MYPNKYIDGRTQDLIDYIKSCDFSKLKEKQVWECKNNFDETEKFEICVCNKCILKSVRKKNVPAKYDLEFGDLAIEPENKLYYADLKISDKDYSNLPASIEVRSIIYFRGYYLNFTQARDKLYIIDANKLYEYLWLHNRHLLEGEYIQGSYIDIIIEFLDNSIVLDI